MSQIDHSLRLVHYRVRTNSGYMHIAKVFVCVCMCEIEARDEIERSWRRKEGGRKGGRKRQVILSVMEHELNLPRDVLLCT